MIILILLLIFIMAFTLPCFQSRDSFESRNKYVFIHVPKNGGTSIKEAIRKHQLPIDYFDHSKSMKQVPPDRHVLIVYRNPVKRFISSFNYGKEVWSANSEFKDVQEFTDALIDPVTRNEVIKGVEKDHTIDGKKIGITWPFEPQVSWWDLDRDPSKIHVLRFNFLENDWKAFLKKEKLKVVDLPSKTQGKGKIINAVQKEDDIRLSNKAKEFIKKKYEEDYLIRDIPGIFVVH